jgi:homoserine O-acetyltransferase
VGSAGPGLGRVETRQVVLHTADDPLVLESGARLDFVEVAYESYGPENKPAIFVCHALTGDAHAAGHHGDPERPGWWDNLIGPGRPLDTDRFRVVCANLLGGCRGTTGPGSIDPASGEPYGLRFPQLSVPDLVALHRTLLRRLGIGRLLAAIGGSLGGMQVLQWAMDHPGEMAGGLVVAASARLSAQNIAFSAVAREAILRDPDFLGGDYATRGRRPDRGLALARMIGHITYLSEASMREKFGRRIQDADTPRHGFDIDFEVESYLHHQGESFVDRFDANSYLYLTRVMDYFDPFGDPVATAAKLAGMDARFLVLSFDSDWRFSTAHAREIVRTLATARVPVTFREISAPFGHDSFLLPVPEYHRTIAEFVDRLAEEERGAARVAPARHAA